MPISPWPFSDPHLDLSVRARTIDRDTFDSNEEFRDLLAEAILDEILLGIITG